MVSAVESSTSWSRQACAGSSSKPSGSSSSSRGSKQRIAAAWNIGRIAHQLATSNPDAPKTAIEVLAVTPKEPASWRALGRYYEDLVLTGCFTTMEQTSLFAGQGKNKKFKTRMVSVSSLPSPRLPVQCAAHNYRWGVGLSDQKRRDPRWEPEGESVVRVLHRL